MLFHAVFLVKIDLLTTLAYAYVGTLGVTSHPKRQGEYYDRDEIRALEGSFIIARDTTVKGENRHASQEVEWLASNGGKFILLLLKTN